MFTTNHFIWLAICAAIIALYLLANKFFKISYKTNLTIIFVVCVISEIVKIASNIESQPYDDTKLAFYLDAGDLPFHLCSMQIFFVTALMFFVKNEQTKQKLLCFMFPTMILGGLIALFIPTVGVKFSKPQVYQFFIFHAFIVAFALYLIIKKVIKLDFKALFRNYGILALLVFVAMCLNSMLRNQDVNFFYLSRPPMDNLPLLNLNNGWFAYFLTLFVIAISALTLLQLPFILINKKHDKIDGKA